MEYIYYVLRMWYYGGMPKVTIWIRVEDWESWRSIEDKPGFIHDAIQLKEMYKMKKLPVYFIKPGKRGHEKIGVDLPPTQEDLIAFVQDQKTAQQAIEGSMQKRSERIGTDLHPSTAARIVENKIKNAQEHPTNLHTARVELDRTEETA